MSVESENVTGRKKHLGRKQIGCLYAPYTIWLVQHTISAFPTAHKKYKSQAGPNF